MRNRFVALSVGILTFGVMVVSAGISFACESEHGASACNEGGMSSCGATAKAGEAPHTLTLASAPADTATPGIRKATFKVKGVTCQSCRDHITTALMQIKGVTLVEFVKKNAQISYNETQVKPAALIAAIKEAGYEAVDASGNGKTKTN